MADKPILEAIQEITVGDVARFLDNAISILAMWIAVWVGLALLVAFIAWMRRKQSARELERRLGRDKHNT